MPNMNGTGPRGEGPKTGRGLGKCSGTNNTQSNAIDIRGLGLGRGRRNCPKGGRGRGQGASYGQNQTSS